MLEMYKKQKYYSDGSTNKSNTYNNPITTTIKSDDPIIIYRETT